MSGQMLNNKRRRDKDPLTTQCVGDWKKVSLGWKLTGGGAGSGRMEAEIGGDQGWTVVPPEQGEEAEVFYLLYVTGSLLLTSVQ